MAYKRPGVRVPVSPPFFAQGFEWQAIPSDMAFHAELFSFAPTAKNALRSPPAGGRSRATVYA